ncbi:MAG: aldo/keto reductase, partial [Bacteroidota bacterium]
LFAEEEMNASLKKLQTDYFDLYQLHVLKTTEDVEQVFAPGGAMEYITKARDKGKVRYIGFSAHSTDAALLALEKFEFDTIMFPINYSCWMEGDFGPAVYDKALEKGSAVLAIKAFAVRRLQEGEPKQHENMWYFGTEEEKLSRLAFGYTMSKKVSSAIPSGDASYFWKAAEYMKDLPEMDENKLNYLITETKRAEPIFPV